MFHNIKDELIEILSVVEGLPVSIFSS